MINDESKKKKRPRDMALLAKSIGDEATAGGHEEKKEVMPHRPGFRKKRDSSPDNQSTGLPS